MCCKCDQLFDNSDTCRSLKEQVKSLCDVKAKLAANITIAWLLAFVDVDGLDT